MELGVQTLLGEPYSHVPDQLQSHGTQPRDAFVFGGGRSPRQEAAGVGAVSSGAGGCCTNADGGSDAAIRRTPAAPPAGGIARDGRGVEPFAGVGPRCVPLRPESVVVLQSEMAVHCPQVCLGRGNG